MSSTGRGGIEGYVVVLMVVVVVVAQWWRSGGGGGQLFLFLFLFLFFFFVTVGFFLSFFSFSSPSFSFSFFSDRQISQRTLGRRTYKIRHPETCNHGVSESDFEFFEFLNF